MTFPIIHSLMRKVIHCQGCIHYMHVYCFGQKTNLILEVAIWSNAILYYKSNETYQLLLWSSFQTYHNFTSTVFRSFNTSNTWWLCILLQMVRCTSSTEKCLHILVLSISLYHKKTKTNHGQLKFYTYASFMNKRVLNCVTTAYGYCTSIMPFQRF